MKITSVDVFLLRPAVSHSTYPSKPVMCRINTDEGISGLGEAGIFTGIGEHAVFGMLQDMAPLVIGRDPMDNEVLWEEIKNILYGHCSGGGVIVFSGMSALDTAMMDIKGKAFGVPCYKLLGGKQNQKLRCYASHIECGWAEDLAPRGSAREYADVAERVMNLGYDMVKCDFIAYDRDKQPLSRRQTAHELSKRAVMKLAEERLCAIRERCGEGMEILIENLCRLDICGSLEMDRLARKYDCLLMEECLDPFRPGNLKVVRDKAVTPLAAGEKVQTRWGYSKYFEEQTLRIIQPDLTNCGGLSETKKVCDMAHVYDVKVQAHAAGTPFAVAAALQLETAIPNFSVHEHLFSNDHPEIKSYCKYNYDPVDGYVSVPELPGIGNELSEQAVREAQCLTIR
ncbi:mandelate racemase/muconate lactonizing enzyme family protein [Harryflintia acetispora]|uniref:mandelate racemase/muconate lactonizing enzyme family protein n=1 Tax=Harryflintia acetispora TaxID=1849041 RepID=UPI0018971330|nr:mandelate racemase/muconate lactonizing enzyme family protein [Harryflintia acetispora]